MENRQSGQIIVLFALFLVVLVGIAGLVLDGGGTFAQRRSEQNAADLAALGGANLQLNGGGDGAVIALARSIATENGYEHGVDGTTVAVAPSAGQVKVDINAPHINYFAGVFGMGDWDVSVTATANWGVPQGTSGSAPIIFSVDAFDDRGLPYLEYGCASAPCTPFDFTKTTGSGSDAPLEATNMAWTVLGAPKNVNTDDVREIIDGTAVVRAAPIINQYIGQNNAGVHNSLFDSNAPNQASIQTNLAGQDVIVPIVGEPVAPATTCITAGGAATTFTNGCFRGWALFHIVSATKLGGGDEGTITGYFKTGIARVGSDVPLCTAGPSCPGFHGLYVLRLTN